MRLDYIRAFLARAVPWPSATVPGYIGIHSPFKGQIPGRAFQDFNNAANYTQGVARSMRGDLYVCMSLQSTAKPSQSGKRMMLDRSKEHALYLRSFYLEIDLFDPKKPKNNPQYKTTDEAAKAFTVWRVQLGLPEPAFVILSGSGGLHIHYVLPEPIHVSIWQPLADAFKNACDAGGLLADPVCTADPSRLLRIPGTHNFKHNPPKEVELVHDRAEITLAAFEAAIGKYKNATPTYAPGVMTGPRLNLGRPSAVFAGVALPGRLDVGIETWKPTIEQVAAECEFIKDIHATGGVGRSEPEWFESLKIAYYVQDGPQIAHELSNGYNNCNYNADEVDEKYAQIDGTHSGGRLGPPTCVGIEGKGALDCLKCKYRGGPPSQSPVNLVKLVAPPSSSAAPAVPPMPTSIAGVTIVTEWPPPFKQDVNGLVYRDIVPDPDTPNVTVREYAARVPILNMWAQEKKDKGSSGYNAVNFSCLPSKSQVPTEIQVRYSDLGDLRKVSAVLGEQGLVLNRNHLKCMQDLMVSFVDTLRQSKNKSFTCQTYGFSDELDAFTFDRVRYNCSGNTPVVPADQMIDDVYRARGEYSEWVKVANLMISQQRPELNFGFAVSAAAPCMKFTGHNGVIVAAYSGDSGVQKSTMAFLSQSLWGKPDGAGAVKDTLNAIDGHLGLLHNLPLILDDIRFNEKDGQRAIEMALNITQGRSKRRMMRSQLLAPTSTWSTVLLTTSNHSMHAYLGDIVGETAAPINRVFEYFVRPNTKGVGLIDVTVAAALEGTLKQNHGLAGRIIGQQFGANSATEKDATLKILEAVNNKCAGTTEDRFWITAAGLGVRGSMLINRLPDIVPINIEQLVGWAVEQVQEQRRSRRRSRGDITNKENVERMITDYLNGNRDRMLMTDKIWNGSGRMPAGWITDKTMFEIKGALASRYGIDQSLIRLSLPEIGKWLKRERHGLMRNAFEAAVRRTIPGAKFIKANLGTGTRYGGPVREDVLEIGLSMLPEFKVEE